MGRPSKFKEEFIAQAVKLCELAATDEEIADFFEVDVRTIYRWKKQNDAFCQALKVGKEKADDRVERSLYHRALGYTHREEKLFQHNGEVVRAETTKHYPPDTTAGIFWLKNRRPDQWRDKPVEYDENGNEVAELDIRQAARDLAFMLMRGMQDGIADAGKARE